MSSEGVQRHHRSRGGTAGTLVLVVGASGAGKDALISGARCRLLQVPYFVFPKRVITRPSHATESHEQATIEEFQEAERRGAFALSWSAHGVRYGIPATIESDLAACRNVVINVSRAVVGIAKCRFQKTAVVLVDCPVSIRADRLALRGRESRCEILSRLSRAVGTFDPLAADVVIDNGGSLESGIRQLVDALHRVSGALTTAP